MNKKHWSFFVIITYFSILGIIGALTIIVDPFFHYHAPIGKMSYQIKEEAYINDGIAKHFDYNAIVTGTSMTENFKTSEADKLFDVESIRISYMGEGFRRINETLNVAVAYNPNLELVIRSVDTLWFVTGEDWLGYSEYPDYLYDDNIWNDVNYLFNKDIFTRNVIPTIIRTVNGVPADVFDDQQYGGDAAGKENVLQIYERMPKENKIIEASETEEFFSLLEANLQKNVIRIIEDNPQITFYLFFPPYSICWWDSLHQYGDDVVIRRIEMEKYAIEMLLPYKNVRLFSFFNNFDMISNLNYYVDDIHFTSEVNSEILKWMSEGKYELTEENYKKYIYDITDYYCNYDYDKIFE